MVIKELYKGISYDIDVDEYLSLGIIRENTGVYCIVKPKVDNALKFVKGSGGFYTRMEIDKGILKGTEVHAVENCLDISQTLKYKGEGIYVIEPLNLCVEGDANSQIKVYQAEKDMKNLEVF